MGVIGGKSSNFLERGAGVRLTGKGLENVGGGKKSTPFAYALRKRGSNEGGAQGRPCESR